MSSASPEPRVGRRFCSLKCFAWHHRPLILLTRCVQLVNGMTLQLLTTPEFSDACWYRSSLHQSLILGWQSRPMFILGMIDGRDLVQSDAGWVSNILPRRLTLAHSGCQSPESGLRLTVWAVDSVRFN